MTDIKLSPCIKCGKDWSDPNDLIDTVYPSLRDSTTGNFLEWNVVCQIHNTGCGRIVYGESEQDAVDRWNQGETDEVYE
jgi:hypothetical protein